MEKNQISKQDNSEDKTLDNHNEKNPIKKIRFWQILTALVAFLLVLSILMGGFSKGILTPTLNKEEIADQTIDFINENLLQDPDQAKLKGVKESNGLYLLKLEINGQEMEFYISNDGKLLFSQAIELTKESTEISNIPKSDKPQVELFIMSHCPFGTQIEKGILPVIKELKDSINFELKFVNYVMHPSQGEVEEQLNQYCIQKEYNEKFAAYLEKFLELGNGKDAFNAIGISEKEISKCIEETDQEFEVLKNLEDQSLWNNGRFPKFNIHNAENIKYEIKGSPALIINNQHAQSGRDAQSLLNIICSAFTKQPEECNTDMTSFGIPAPGFGFEPQGDSTTSASCEV